LALRHVEEASKEWIIKQGVAMLGTGLGLDYNVDHGGHDVFQNGSQGGILLIEHATGNAGLSAAGHEQGQQAQQCSETGTDDVCHKSSSVLWNGSTRRASVCRR